MPRETRKVVDALELTAQEVQTITAAAVTKALGNQKELVKSMVETLLDNRNSYDNPIKKFIEQKFLEEVKAAIAVQIELRRPEIEAVVKEKLPILSNERMFDALKEGLSRTLANSLSVSFNTHD